MQIGVILPTREFLLYLQICRFQTMSVVKIYTEDLHIAEALIKRDEVVTRNFFYKKCYPLFKSIFDNYHTDCGSVIEFISEVYVILLSPSKTTGKCQMDNFRGESTLASWLKSACLFYCYNKYQCKTKMPIVGQLPNPNDEKYDNTDRYIDLGGSSELYFDNMNRQDIETMLNMMPNKRYSNLIRLRYLNMKTNEETAEALGINMDNYYNVHKRAKAQYEQICRKEDYYG